MTGCEIVKNILKKDEVSQADLAKAMNVHRRNVSMYLTTQQDLKTAKFIEMLDYLGYSITLKKEKYKRIYFETDISKLPSGVYWYEENGIYFAVDKNENSCSKIEFKTKDECTSYLSKL